MMKQRVVIQDLNERGMPKITEMTDVVSIEGVSGPLLRFVHEDGRVTVINIAPGWNVDISEDKD